MVAHTLLALAVFAAPVADVADRPVPTTITNVGVFQPDGRVVGPLDVTLADGVITAIAPAAPHPQTGGTVVDGTGRTLLPGLIDLHVHIQAYPAIPGRVRVPRMRENLRQFLYCGVTTVLDLSMSARRLKQVKRAVRKRWASPAVYGSGLPFTAPGGHPISAMRETYPGVLMDLITGPLAHQINNDAEMTKALRRHGESDVLKIMLDEIPRGMPVIEDGPLALLRTQATTWRRPVLAHVGRASDMKRAVALPVDALAHVPYADAIEEESVAAMVSAGIAVIPTLAVWQSVELLYRKQSLIGPIEQEILRTSTLKDMSRVTEGTATFPPRMQAWAQEVTEHHSDRIQNVHKLADAGVDILVGSDSPNAGIAAGAGLHRELDQLAQAGQSAAEILIAATWKNSRFLDPEAKFGAVKVGWEADLVLVEGDPVQNLDNVHRIVEVWIDGRHVQRHPRRGAKQASGR